MSRILLKDEYLNFIEHCESLRNGMAIKLFINDIDKQYSQYNSEMLLVLMEFIVEEYPRIQNIENFHAVDILNFKEEVTDIERPQLHYLYSYICHLHDNMIEYQRIAKNKNIVNPMHSFSSTFSNAEHKRIFDWLISNNYIAQIDFKIFKLVFENVLLVEIKQKIQWTSTYNGKNNMQPLFHLLHILCSHEYDSMKKENFASKILACFNFNSPTTIDNIRQNFYSWKNALKVGYKDPQSINIANFLYNL